MNTPANALIDALLDASGLTYSEVYTPANVREARHVKQFGYLLSVNQDPKTVKTNRKGKFLTAIMFLKPGVTCPFATPGCRRGCLHKAGNPAYMPGKEKARHNRYALLRNHPKLFYALLIHELERFFRKCRKYDVTPCVRLNGTSDIPWERVAPWLLAHYSDVQFYDYTKEFGRLGCTPANYDLTFSRSECNDFECGMAVARGFRIAVVMRRGKNDPNPDTWNGYAVNDADTDDLTFMRPDPIQGLYAKGPAIKDTTGFVAETDGTVKRTRNVATATYLLKVLQ